jgi:predicted AlkP superfamily phosphohydrolase/phosphomutase
MASGNDTTRSGASRPPGIGRRGFVKLAAGSLGAAAMPLPLLSCGGPGAGGRKVVVLGLDGLDPNMLRAMIDAGRAPNFAKLARMGSFGRLGTTMPALSPVAWSSFITGQNPGGHGIADFIARDPETHDPVFSIWEPQAPDFVLDLGDLHLPIKGGGPINLRRGRPFWSYLTDQGIPSFVSKIPTNYPVDETATYAISGMGTPDLADAYGMFAYYTTDEFEDFPEVEGGNVFYIDVQDNVAAGELIGPVNSLWTPQSTRHDPLINNTKVPFKIYRDPARDAARIDIQGQSIVLRRGEYSDWVRVQFTLMPVLGEVSGIVRFLLKETRPHLKLYVTPVNIDPEHQAGPVTYPASFGAEIARDIGAFWTKGLPADTKAFDYGIINDEEYVKQAELILRERMALFDHQWARFKEGLFYFYVSSTDQDAHMLWRNMDETHPMHDRSDLRFAGYLKDLYEEMDKLVGKVLPAVDDDTLLLICSDHGFVSFGRQFHLNTWLRDNGYLALKPGVEKKPETSVRDIDWSRTVAYGIGFNGLYVNRKGREAHGIVDDERAGELVARLSRELEGLTDPETGQRPVAKVYRREEVYSGEMLPGMPELLVGYTPGYRCASRSVIGSTGDATIDLNPWAWSGDHSMARDLVPGTLLSSQPVRKAKPNIVDLPVSILDFFGIERPGQMDGTSIFRT